MIYNFNVSNLVLTCTNSRKIITSDSVNYHTATFVLDSGWDNMTTITAIFTNSKDTSLSVSQLLDVNKSCNIPANPISNDGYLLVKLVGETSSSRIETEMGNNLTINLSTIGDGGTDIIFTPTIVEQLQTLIDGKGDNLTYFNNILSLKSGSDILSQVTISGGSGGSAYIEIVNDGTWIKYRTDPLATTWINIISVASITGTDGREVQIRSNGTAIQWNYVGDTTWTDIVQLSTLKGTDGKQVELRNDGSYIQWRYVGDTTWINLVPLSSISGTNGVGISSVTKTGTSGLVDTYTITYTNSTTTTFNVTNGSNGTNGVGISTIVKTGTVGLIDTYTITFTDSSTTTFNVTNGANGLTTSILLNSISYVQSGGVITLPALEPALPSTPDLPTNKYLNGNRQWSDIVIGGGGYQAPLYFSATDSTSVTGYKALSYTPDSSETEYASLITTSEQLLRSYIYPTAIGVTTINSGSWIFTANLKVSGTTGVSRFKHEIFVRHTDNTETILFSQYTEELNNTTYEVVTTQSTQPTFTVLSTDRLGVKIYGAKTAGSDITLYSIIGGTRSANFVTPVPPRHSQLRDLNGDSNYQHVTQTWIDSVNTNISALLPQGTLDSTSTGTVTKALTQNIPIKISTALTSLTLTLPSSYNWYDVFTIIFSTSALTLPSGVVWHDGTAPTITSGKWYELSIRDGRAVLSGGASS